ncbi:MAG: hypothetical protein NTV21_02115 [Planctomycetota bacterium]|nr:hypothetical protein [Planctomycetota bacterium]
MNSSKGIRAFAILGSVIGVACAIALFRNQSGPSRFASAEPSDAVSGSEAGGQAEARRAAVECSEIAGAASVKTIRNVFEELDVRLTPELLEGLAADGVDLNQPIEIPPWEDVHSHFEQELGSLSQEKADAYVKSVLDWPAELSAAVLAKKFPLISERGITLDDLQLAEIDALVSGRNHEIESLAVQYCDGLRYALESEWRSGRFHKAPVSSRVIPKTGRRAFYAAATGHRAWAAKIYLYEEDYPELRALSAGARQAATERDRQVVTYLKAQAR